MFDEKTHTYTKKGRVLESTTQKIKNFVPEFNAEQVAQQIAKYKKISAGRLLLSWLVKGEMATGFGNFSHATCRMFHVDKPELEALMEIGTSPHITILYNMMKDLTEKYDIVEMEIKRVSDELDMGYTIDMVCKSKVTIDEPIPHWAIFDFKTNRYATSDQYKAAKGKLPALLKIPFRNINLRDIAVDKAAIQLSLYALALAYDPNITYFKEYDLPDVRRMVLHVPMNYNQYPKGYAIYALPNIDIITLAALNGENGSTT